MHFILVVFCTLAWKIPWTEEPDALQSMELLRVRQDWLSNFTFTFHFHPLDKELAPHSSVLAWRIPGMGSHRVGHNWSDLATAAKGFPCGSAGKESACNVGDLGLIPGSGRSPREGKATHSSILAWRIPWGLKESVHGVSKSWTRLSDFHLELPWWLRW